MSHTHDDSCYHHRKIEHKLDRILLLLRTILIVEVEMSAELDALEVQVKKNEDVENSAVLLIQGIAAQLRAAGQDPVKLKELADGLSTSADSLASAVAANTPAAT